MQCYTEHSQNFVNVRTFTIFCEFTKFCECSTRADDEIFRHNRHLWLNLSILQMFLYAYLVHDIKPFIDTQSGIASVWDKVCYKELRERQEPLNAPWFRVMMWFSRISRELTSDKWKIFLCSEGWLLMYNIYSRNQQLRQKSDVTKTKKRKKKVAVCSTI